MISSHWPRKVDNWLSPGNLKSNRFFDAYITSTLSALLKLSTMRAKISLPLTIPGTEPRARRCIICLILSWTSLDLSPADWTIECKVMPSLASMLANLGSPEDSRGAMSRGDLNAHESQLIQSSCLSSPEAVTIAATTWAFQTSRSWIFGHAGITIFSCSFLEILLVGASVDVAAVADRCSVSASPRSNLSR